jgi:hypothetical protein
MASANHPDKKTSEESRRAPSAMTLANCPDAIHSKDLQKSVVSKTSWRKDFQKGSSINRGGIAHELEVPPKISKNF